MNRPCVSIVAYWIVVAPCGAFAQTALGPTFNYQGKLDLRGAPLDDTADFEFSLWDTDAGGSQVGSTQTVSNVTVTNGLFTVMLNSRSEFGPSAFNGDARWLQIAVRSPHDPGDKLEFITLSPLQPITAAPYAVFAMNGGAAGQADGHSLDAVDGNPADAVFVDESGNVGIGTNVPSAPLDVAGGIRSRDNGAGFYIFNPNNAGASAHFSWLNDTARIRVGGSGPGANGGFSVQRIGDETLLRITDNRRIGITEAEPLVNLHVTGESNGLNSSALENDEIVVEAQDAVMGLYSTSQGEWGSAIALKEVSGGSIVDTWGIARRTSTTSDPSALRITYGSSENYASNPAVMSLDAAGNVGIGTTIPQSKLAVNGTIESESGGFRFPDGTVQTTAVNNLPGNGSLPFNGTVATSATAFSVTNDGTGRAAYFESSNDGEALRAISATDNVAVVGINNGTGSAGFFQNFGGSASTLLVSSFADGNALNAQQFGDGGPAGHFEINNSNSSQPAITAVVTNGTGYAIDAQGTINAAGDIVATGNLCGANVTCPSDARFKSNVRPLSGALAKIDRITPVSFYWKRKAYPDRRFNDTRQVGLIAQEIREILPGVVHEDRDGYLSVDYGRLTPVLIEAVKELKQAVHAKDAEIAALRREKDEHVAKLAARLNRLEDFILNEDESATSGE